MNTKELKKVFCTIFTHGDVSENVLQPGLSSSFANTFQFAAKTPTCALSMQLSLFSILFSVFGYITYCKNDRRPPRVVTPYLQFQLLR